MTVTDLIEQLKTLQPDMPVLVQGYESGWDRIFELRVAGIVPYRRAKEWDGEYREAGEFKQTGHPAVLIVGKRGQHR